MPACSQPSLSTWTVEVFVVEVSLATWSCSQAPAAPRDVLGSAAVVLAAAAALPNVPPPVRAAELAAGLFPGAAADSNQR